MAELNFTLEMPLEKIAMGGVETTVTELVLHAPPAKHKKYPIKMRKIFSAAMMSLADNRKEQEVKPQEESDLDGESVIQMLYMANADIEKMHDLFKELICLKGMNVCLMNDSEPLTEFCYDKIDANDIDRLLGDYLANFMVPSWMPKDTK